MITASGLERPGGEASAKGYLLLRHRPVGNRQCLVQPPAHSLASGELAADKEGYQGSHKSRRHEASVDGIIGRRSAAQPSPHQNLALGEINIGCLGVAGRAGVNRAPSATKG